MIRKLLYDYSRTNLSNTTQRDPGIFYLPKEDRETENG